MLTGDNLLSVQGRIVRIASEPRTAPRGGYLFRGIELSPETDEFRIFLMFPELLGEDLYNFPLLCWEGAEVAAYNLQLNNRLAEGNEIYTVTPESDLVLEPYRPVSVTDAVEAAACMRSADVRFRVGPDEPFWMAKGKLIHSLFQRAIQDFPDCEETFEEAFHAALPTLMSVLPGSDVAVSHESLREEARLHFRNLVSWVQKHRDHFVTAEMETDRISSRWGLKGRADAIFRNPEDSIIVELKTGKVPVPEHLLQLHAYRLLFASTGPKTNLDGYVVYSATGRTEPLGDLSRSSTRAILEGRNRVVALRKGYTDSETIIPAQHTCERNGICFARKDCRRLFGEEQNQQLFFTPMERDYYDRWFKLLSLEAWAQQEAFARILDPRTLNSRLAEGVTIRVLLARLLDRSAGSEAARNHASEDRPAETSTGHATNGAMSLDLPATRMLLSVPEDGLDLNRGDEIILHRGMSTGPEAFRARIDATEAGSVTVSLKSPVAYTSAPIQLPSDTLQEPEGWFLDRLPFSGGPEVSSRALFNFFVRADREIVDVVVGGDEKPGSDQSPDQSFPALGPLVSAEPPIPGDSEEDADSAVPQDLCYSEGLLAELNEDQEAAVEAAFHSPSYQLIHGPPGTGKTRVLARLIKMCLDHGERVLVSCPTNVAVDRLLLAVIELGVRGILRIGGKQAVSQEFLEAARRLGNPPALLHELASLNRDMRTFRKVVAETMLVCATAYQCAAHPFFRRQRFDRVVVDEAGQVDEPSTLGPLALAPKFVLGGDHLQLPPIVQACGVNASGDWDAALDQSLFERLYKSAPHSRVSALRLQYRMNREVQEIPSRLFYGGELEPAAEVAQRRLKISVGSNDDLQMEKILAPENPVVFVDVLGSDGGKWRVAEAAAASRIAKSLLARGVPAWEVGIITPYRAQQSLIKRELAAGHQERPFLAVDTVDRFQGGEREVIILSLARSDGVTSFLADRKRLNVSLSRARSKLILVGHGQTLEEHPLFCAVLAGLERITI